MAITFRHDAAAVALPSSTANRKYGQQLVLQQQQQKYQGHQAGLDRLFDANKQQQQNMFQFGRDQQQRNFQWDMGQAQNKFQADRDKAQFDQQQQQQRKADFDAARNRIDTHAKDMLANGEITDPDARQRIQNLIAGKTIVMGSDFDETARQNYLDQYNAELAKILSEVPPAKPKPPPQPNFHTDENGNQWVESGPGKWEQVPQPERAPSAPSSAGEAFKADPKTAEKYLGDADSYLMGDTLERPSSGRTDAEGKPIPMNDQEYRRARNKLAAELYDIDQESFGGGQPASPAGAPPAGSGSLPVIPPARGMVDPVTGQQFETGAFETMPGQPPQMTQQAARDAIAGMQDQMSGVRITDDGQRVVPAPLGPPMPHLRTDSGIPVTPPDQGQPPSPVPQREPMPVTSNSSSQNPWSDVAAADGESAAMKSSPGRKELITSSTQGTNGLPQVAPPDFGKLVEAAPDDNEKAVISQIQGLVSQHADSPDVVNALHVFVSPGSTKENRLAAFDYLSAAGIDLYQMVAEEPGRAEKLKSVHKKNQERYGSRYDIFPGEY